MTRAPHAEPPVCLPIHHGNILERNAALEDDAERRRVTAAADRPQFNSCTPTLAPYLDAVLVRGAAGGYVG